MPSKRTPRTGGSMAVSIPQRDELTDILLAAIHKAWGGRRGPPHSNSGRGRRLLLHLHRLMRRVFDVIDSVDYDVADLSADFLDTVDIDGLHDVAGLRVDHDRAARTGPLRALHRADQLFGVGVTLGLFQTLVDEGDAVIAADREEVWVGAAEFFLVGGDKVLVHF